MRLRVAVLGITLAFWGAAAPAARAESPAVDQPAAGGMVAAGDVSEKSAEIEFTAGVRGSQEHGQTGSSESETETVQTPDQPEDLLLRLHGARLEPLKDSGAGRLYAPAARLLNELRNMPQAVRLPTRQSAPPETSGDTEPASDATPVAVATESDAEADGWLVLFDQPVVDTEKLAHVEYRAKRYERAAYLYRVLNNREPDNVHFAAMLCLSLRNAGKTEESIALLRELKAEEPARPWAEWMETMLQLAGEAAGEKK